MLEIRNLTVRYDDRIAVEHFDLALGDGEIVTLVGPTGCGKSSVLRAVAGFEQPATGAIVIGDLEIDPNHPVPPEKRRTGLVFQDFALFPHMTVAENIGFKVEDKKLVEHWIDRLGLSGHREAMPATLSGGQKQRVALARSLAHQPALVLLDEPLSNLDAALKSSLRWDIREALKTSGVPALWVTHDQDEALSVGDRVGIMHSGRLEQIGEPEECYRAPQTRFVARFLGEGFFVRGRLDGATLKTGIGESALADPAAAAELAHGGEVDALIRPHDVALVADSSGNAVIEWSRYEGETRLYAICLRDGTRLQARVSHDVRLSDGESVQTQISARHALALFAPGEG